MAGRVQDRLFPDQQGTEAVDRVGLAYRFFLSRAGQDFSLDELAAATGWRMSTVLTYRSRLYRDRWEFMPGDRYRFPAVSRMSEDDFRHIHSQARFRVPPWYRRLEKGTARQDREWSFRPPLAWDGADLATRADTIRDCLAFAASGGGTIIIGVTEPEPGRLLPAGLTEDQARGSVPAAIAADLGQQVSGRLVITARAVTAGGRRFVQLTVRGHDGVPPVPLISGPGLCQGHIYCRTADGRSVPVRTADDLRPILGGRSLLS